MNVYFHKQKNAVAAAANRTRSASVRRQMRSRARQTNAHAAVVAVADIQRHRHSLEQLNETSPDKIYIFVWCSQENRAITKITSFVEAPADFCEICE